MIYKEAIAMAVSKKRPYSSYALNGASIPPAKSGFKVIDGNKLAQTAQLEIQKGLQEVAASEDKQSQ
jgi:hypothetical protein